MNREWKPGDLIVDEGGCVFWVVPTYPEDSARPHRGIDADGNDWFVNTIEGARRLVVLDPESDDDMRRVVDAFFAKYAYDRASREHAMQAALRELANPTPPKPEEPTGLGAVVVDREGGRWVRVSTTRGSKQEPCEWRAAGYVGSFRLWPEIDAVRVLFEGVES